MKFYMRLISIIVVLVMLLGSVTVAFAAEYQDVSKKHWAKADIEWATAQGLMNGTGEGKFSPEGSAERAMLVTILYRSAGEPAVSGSTPFTDLKQAWYKKAVLWAYQNGIVNGTSATTFGPSAKITREQLATILYRYTQNMLKYNVSLSGSLGAFPDQGKISAYAREAMLWANTAGLVNGNLKGNVSYLEPKGKATRAQLAAIFHRFDTYREANKPADPSPTPTPTPDPEPEPTPPAPSGITIPALTGKTLAEARSAVTALGLYAVAVNGTYDPAKGENTVLAQKPAAGSTAQAGDTVTLTMNVKPAPQAVPDLLGKDQNGAVAALKAVNLQINCTVAPYRMDVVPGLVQSQSPAKGTVLEYGSVVTVVLSGAPQALQLPDFRGMTQAKAEEKAAELQIKLNFETALTYNADYGEDTVCAQGATGTFTQGETLTLTLNPPVPKVAVPNFLGMDRGQANAAAMNVGLLLNTTDAPYSLSFEVGEVLQQAPVAGTSAPINSVVQLTLNGAPQAIALPDFIGLTEQQARAKAAELQIHVTFTDVPYNKTYTAGAVCAQDATGELMQGETLGLTLNGQPQNVVLPDLTGKTEAQAREVLAGLQLNGTPEPAPYDRNYAEGVVLEQRPTAGSPVLQGTGVNVVLNGAPQSVALPDFTGMTQVEAQARIDELQFFVEFRSGTYTMAYPKGAVIAQSVAAGETAVQGTLITLTVNGEPQLVTLPDFSGMTETQARSKAAELNLQVSFTTGAFVLEAAQGAVVAQSVAAGTTLPEGSSLTLTLNGDPQQVTVPDLTNYTLVDAMMALEALGLRGNSTVGAYELPYAAGVIRGQSVTAGSSLLQGETVALTVNGQPQYVEAPALVGLDREAAKTAAAGLQLKTEIITHSYHMDYAPGEVLSQSVTAGESILQGGTVTLTVNGQPETVAVPALVGMTPAQAVAAAKAAKFNIVYTQDSDPEAENAKILTQSPVAGTLLVQGSTLTLKAGDGHTGLLTLSAYNVELFQANGSIDYDAYAAELQRVDADIVALTKVENNSERTGNVDQMKTIAAKAGYPYYYFGVAHGPTDTFKGEYGSGILSKYPMEATHGFFTAQEEKEKRGYVRAVIDLGGKKVTAYSIHLAYAKGGGVTLQPDQLQELMTMTAEDENPIVMGVTNLEPANFGTLIPEGMVALNGGADPSTAVDTLYAADGSYAYSNIILPKTAKVLTDPSAPTGFRLTDAELSGERHCYVYITLDGESLPETVTVPNVLGKTKEEAKKLLDESGVEYTISTRFTPGYGYHQIGYQSIYADGLIPKEKVKPIQLYYNEDYTGYLRVATYNVWRFRQKTASGSGVDAMDEMAAEIKTIDPDIIGFQEVTSAQIPAMAEKLGYPYYHFTLAYEGHDYGHGIVSKYPITKAQKVMYDVQQPNQSETRAYGKFAIDVCGTEVMVYNTHLCLKTAQIQAQFDQVYTDLLTYCKQEGDQYAVLMGDLNATPKAFTNYYDLTMTTPLNGSKSLNATAVTFPGGDAIDQILISDTFDHYEEENGLGVVVNHSPYSDHNMAYTFLRIPPEADHSGALTVATYNVNAFQVGTYGAEINYAMFGRVLKKVDADLVALQRLDRNSTRSKGVDQVKEIAKESGYPYYYFGGLMPYKEGEYGIALLSKYPFTATHGNFTVASGEDPEWGYIRAEVNLGDRIAVAYAARTDNVDQVGELKAMLEKDPGAVAFGSLGISVNEVNNNLPAGYSSVNQGKNATMAVRHLHVLYPTERMGVITDETAPDGLRNENTALYSSREAYAHLYFKEEGVPETVTLPDFRGKTKAEAEALAKELGLRLEIIEKTNDGYGFNQISAQSELAGSVFPAEGRLLLEHNADHTGWLKVVSYNVKDFIYDGDTCKQGPIQYDTIAAQLRATNADIVGLQEIDKNAQRSGYGDQMKIIAEKAGYPYYYFAKTKDHESGGEYGHGILSKYPITASSVHFFNSQDGETRNVERHEINVNGTAVVFYNTHLNGTTAQFSEIQELMKKDEYAILTGDMNFQPTAIETVLDQTRFTALNGLDPHQRLITTTNSYKCIDNIVVTNNFDHYADANGCGIFVNPSDYSDHRMITTYLKIKQ